TEGLPLVVDGELVGADALGDRGIRLSVGLDVRDLRFRELLFVGSGDRIEVRIAELDATAGVHDAVLEFRLRERRGRGSRAGCDVRAAGRYSGRQTQRQKRAPHTSP